MDENHNRLKIRVRVKERVPEEERRCRRRPDTALWIIVVILLGVSLGYIITSRLLKIIKLPEVQYIPPDERVISASKEKLVLEYEDLILIQTPVSTPENP